MKKHKNIERIKYLAYHHKKVRVRKKNLKRLNRSIEMRKPCKVNRATLFGGNWHHGSHAGLFSLGLGSSKSYERPIGAGFRLLPPIIVDRGTVKFLPPENVDRCVMCGEIIPEGRQVCPNCERSVKE